MARSICGSIGGDDGQVDQRRPSGRSSGWGRSPVQVRGQDRRRRIRPGCGQRHRRSGTGRVRRMVVEHVQFSRCRSQAGSGQRLTDRAGPDRPTRRRKESRCGGRVPVSPAVRRSIQGRRGADQLAGSETGATRSILATPVKVVGEPTRAVSKFAVTGSRAKISAVPGIESDLKLAASARRMSRSMGERASEVRRSWRGCRLDPAGPEDGMRSTPTSWAPRNGVSGVIHRVVFKTSGTRTGAVPRTAPDRAVTPAGPTGPAGRAQAFPRIRLRFVPQTGHLAFAIRVPLSLTCTSPEASRFSLHFTQ